MMQKLRKALLFISPLIISFTGLSSQESPSALRVFEENKNQWDERVKFRYRIPGMDLFLEKNTFTYLFHNREDQKEFHHHKSEDVTVRYHALRVNMLESNTEVCPVGISPGESYSNYFIGSDPSHWASYVLSYEKIHYSNIYDGIDLNYYYENKNLKYDFIVKPGADFTKIKLEYTGQDQLSLIESTLFIKTSLGEIKEQRPFAYQVIEGVKRPVTCEYILDGNILRFDIRGDYNTSYELIIDPILIASTYTGSTADNFGFTGTYDKNGNIYSGGNVEATGYPVSTGAFQLTYRGGTGTFPMDCGIIKYNPTGTTRIFATYLGGTLNDQPHSMVVTQNDELIVYGRTYSTNFPVTTGAYDNTQNGGSDIFVVKFNAAGSALVGSTFIGGTADDGVNISATPNTINSLKYNYADDGRGEVIIDNNGNIYVASFTKSNNFPVTVGAYQTTFGGTQDGCVFKLDPTLTTLTWSTYLGGSANDAAYALTLDKSDNVYVTGGTASTNFPTTAGTIHPATMGAIDGYISLLKNDGTGLIASSYIGTASYDQSYFVQLDKDGFVYLLGQSEGAYPVTGGVYSTTNGKQFIHKLNDTLTTTLFSTVVGTTTGQYPNISPTAFLVDNCYNIYLSGWGRCSDLYHTAKPGSTNNLPITPNAFQNTTDGCDFYLMVLTKDAAALAYGTFFGDPNATDHVDGGTSRFDKNGIVYQSVCASCGGSQGFPTTPGAWSTTNNSNNCNNAIFKFDFQQGGVVAVANTTNTTVCGAPATITFTNGSTGAIYYIWTFGDGSPNDTTKNPIHTYTLTGTYTVTLVAIDPASCNGSDTTQVVVTILPNNVTVNLGNDTTVCNSVNLTLNAGNPGNSYTWNTGATTQTINVTTPGKYWVKVGTAPCTAVDTINVTVISLNNTKKDTTVCGPPNLTISAGNPGATYSWNTGATTQTIPVNSIGKYWVQVTLGLCSKIDTTEVKSLAPPVVDLGKDSTLCGTPNITLNAGNPGSTYTWSTGANTQTITVTTGGSYWVIVGTVPCTDRDTVTITITPPPNVNLGNDTTICGTPNKLLNAGNPGSTYTWSTGATTQTIIVTTGGTYWVKANNGGCIDTDTIKIITISPSSKREASFCAGLSTTLDAGNPGANYSWSTGATTQTIPVTSGGIYWVWVTSAGCVSTDTIIVNEIPTIVGELKVPNVFTPNGDSKNQYFEVQGLKNFKDYNIKIYDRWGLKMFESSDPNINWDGLFKSKDAPAGVYYFILEYNDDCLSQEGAKHGFLHLLR